MIIHNSSSSIFSHTISRRSFCQGKSLEFFNWIG
nr:MAG TPA: hypothetical protein [Siphoviridae sp. ctFjF5]DAU57452.1 MAG TPA: hypothetical protein [Caudoviricetes sp.]